MKHLSHNFPTIMEECPLTRHNLFNDTVATQPKAKNQFEVAARRAREGVIRPHVAYLVQRLLRRTVNSTQNVQKSE